jgi:hypothetical protein
MKVYQINIINALILILLGLWGYWGSETPSPTALIPVLGGALLLALFKGVKSGNKAVAHIAVILTLILLIGLLKPLTGALGRSDNVAIVRVAVMIISCSVAMVYFVRSFINVRRARIKAGE